jgi:hypothetical protein
LKLAKDKKELTTVITAGAIVIILAIPATIYAMSLSSQDRTTFLLAISYLAAFGVVLFIVRSIRRALRGQPIPVLERFLTSEEAKPFLPPDFNRISEAVKASLRSRTYFRRILWRRIEKVVDVKQESGVLSPLLVRLKENMNEEKEEEVSRFQVIKEIVTRRGVPMIELEKIIAQIEKL